jgi:flagellar motor switch protein FliG
MKSAGAQRVASLLLTIDRESATQIVRGLPPADRERVAEALAELSEAVVGSESQVEVLRRFELDLLESEGEIGSRESIRGLLEAAFGEEAAPYRKRLEEKEDPLAPAKKALREVDPAALASLLAEEHPQAGATLLFEMGPEVTAKVLPHLPAERRTDLVARMANHRPPPPEVLAGVLEAAARRAKTAAAPKPKVAGPEPVEAVASALKKANEATTREVLESLAEKDATLAERVRERLFAFEDLVRLGPRDVQRVLGSVDTKVLAMALKAASPEISELLLSNISQRARERVNEERETLGAVRLSEVRAAQGELAKAARELVERGEIRLGGAGEDELVT